MREDKSSWEMRRTLVGRCAGAMTDPGSGPRRVLSDEWVKAYALSFAIRCSSLLGLKDFFKVYYDNSDDDR